MVKIKLITAITAIAILVGCGSYASTGAYTGATLGSILGSAIGGITGGPRGSDIGQIVGMGVGGVVGATIGEQADKKVIKGIEKDASALSVNAENEANTTTITITSKGSITSQPNKMA